MTQLKHLIEFAFTFIIFTLMRFLPLFVVRSFAYLIGAFYASLPIKMNAATRARIQKALPDLNQQQVGNIQYQSTINIATTLLELPKIYNWSKKTLLKKVIVEGNFPDQGPVLILTAHLGQWELIRHYTNKCHFPMASIYRKANNKLVDKLIFNARAKSHAPLIAKGHSGSRQLLKTLKEGISLGLLNDQKMSDGIPTTFFGQPAKTASAIAELSLKRKLPIVPVFCYHSCNGFTLEVGEPLQPEQEPTPENIASLTQKCNDIMEQAIRKHPEQWFWQHKRFS